MTTSNRLHRTAFSSRPSSRLVGPALGLAALVSATTWLLPAPAAACGGTFCDQTPPEPGEPPPPPMPVDQTGETVIFAVDGDMIEAHIRIEFDPESGAERFAWLIPLPTAPEFGVSSQTFFERMELATVPVFSWTSQTASCTPPSGGGGSFGGDGNWDGGGGGAGGGRCSDAAGSDGGFSTGWGGDETGSTSAESTGGSGGGEDDGGQSGKPEIVDRGLVGAFEYVVLDGGTVEGVMTWLAENEYDPDPNAEPILAEYLEEGHVFVALKLRASAGTSAIHPIRLRFQGDEFCVPLRLTQIAAVEDMAVRVMVLGASRAAPANWEHVVPNPVAFDWLNVAANYREVLVMAIDAAEGGHGWATEYAGTSNIVWNNGITDERWDETAFAEVTPTTFVPLLREQGLLEICDQSECSGGHPLGPSILTEFLPVPENVDPEAFYDCVECFEGLIDPDLFDPAAIQAAVAERIFEPGRHAVDLLSEHPYLTRMVTYISPWEMNEDPTFHTNPDLQIVRLPTTARRYTDCSGSSSFHVDHLATFDFFMPSGPNTWVSNPDMPWALRTERIPATGAAQVLIDNEATIRELLGPQANNHAPTSAARKTRKAGADCPGSCACSVEDDGGRTGFLALLTGFGMLLRRRRRR